MHALHRLALSRVSRLLLLLTKVHHSPARRRWHESGSRCFHPPHNLAAPHALPARLVGFLPPSERRGGTVFVAAIAPVSSATPASATSTAHKASPAYGTSQACWDVEDQRRVTRDWRAVMMAATHCLHVAKPDLPPQQPVANVRRTLVRVSSASAEVVVPVVMHSAGRSELHVLSNDKTGTRENRSPPVPTHASPALCCTSCGSDSVRPHVSSCALQSSVPPGPIRIVTDFTATEQDTTIGIEVLKPQPSPGTSSSYADDMSSLAATVQGGLLARVAPIPVDDCTGGVYYLRTKNRRLAAVFKPADEEAYASNSPKTLHKPELSPSRSRMRQGIAPGDAAVREVAAYLLDHGHLAKVPATALAAASHPSFHYQEPTAGCRRKVGALQTYVPHKCTADDVGSSLFDLADVHAMAILDIRLANQDRHGGNVLVLESSPSRKRHSQAKQFGLVPIDHGACLPRMSAMSETSFLWLFWSQASQPFSPTELEYIAALDARRDLELLQINLPTGQDLEREAKLTLLVCTVLLQVCALDLGMTAHSIGLLMCRHGTARQHEMKPSTLETLVALASQDPAVLKSENLWKTREKLQTSASPAKSAKTDNTWHGYADSFVSAFRRGLIAHFEAK